MFGFFYIQETPGLTPCSNLCSSASPSHFAGSGLGWSGRREKRWWRLAVPCRKCHKRVTYKLGVICANFGFARGTSRSCTGAWCAACFQPHHFDVCETVIPRDFNGASLAEVEDEARFKRARPGDHLCCPFQCPDCQSQNIRGRGLTPGEPASDAFECFSIRCTLDAFWSRSTRTVGGHVREVNFILKYADVLGITHPLPRLGPFPLGKHLGMKEAIMLVMRSREPGRGGGTIAYATARRLRGTYTTLWEASPDGFSDLVLTSGSVKGRFVLTHAPSEGRWYQRFAQGVSARMGDIVRQDRAYTIEIVLAVVAAFEREWQLLGYSMPLSSINACMFFLVSCLGGMRGFEVVWTDLGALRYDLAYCESHEDLSAVSWPIIGRFKAEHGTHGCYMIPIAGETNHGINFFQWTLRFVNRLEMEGLTEGWAFQRADGSRAFAADYRHNIFSKLEDIQSATTLIDPLCDVWADYGIQRSGRRFLTTHATNMGCSPHYITLQMRWSTDRANGVRTVKRSMLHTYSEVRNMKESLKESQLC